MESMKQGATISPETSSEDGPSDQVNGDTSQKSNGSRRSYECTYCKRGFTNAQALGGHMNIHRKDRAKAKQSTVNSSHQLEALPSLSPPRFSSHNWYQPTYNINHVDHQSNYYHHHNVYVHDQPSSEPFIIDHASFPYGYSNFEASTVVDNRSLAINEELMRVDLSLQIDSSSQYFDRHDDQRGLVSDELDLELRLGHG